jgi:hypothetical protein
MLGQAVTDVSLTPKHQDETEREFTSVRWIDLPDAAELMDRAMSFASRCFR